MGFFLISGYVCSLANVDPVDVARNISGLDPETTLGNTIYVYMSCITF